MALNGGAVIRRQFLEQVTKLGTTGLIAVQTGCTRERQTVIFRIEGFTCITCATGLETLLSRERGVVSVVASYPKSLARVTFDPGLTTPETLAQQIQAMGFRASRAA